MNCDGVRGLLSAYLDGELVPGDLLRVEQHLRRCHGCADEVDALRRTVSLVAALPVVDVPADFHTRLHNRLVALGPPVIVRPAAGANAWQRHLRDWALPAAAAAAVLAVSLAGLRQVGTQLPPGLSATQTATIEKRSEAALEIAVNPGGGDVVSQPVSGSTTAQPTGSQPKPPVDVPRSSPSVDQPNAQLVGANPAPIGTVIPPALSAHTASYLKDLPALQVGAQQIVYRYAITGKVVDPAVTSAVLMAKYGSRAEAPSPSELTIRVPKDTVAAELAFVKKVLGSGVTESTPVVADLAPTIQRTLSELLFLDSRRENLVKSGAAASDSTDVTAAVQELERVKGLSDQARAAYDQLLKTADEATILVVLEKQAQ